MRTEEGLIGPARSRKVLVTRQITDQSSSLAPSG